MIIAIVGTGTGVGKTHVAAALLRHLRAGGQRVLGWKPVESGVPPGVEGEDERALREACGVAAKTLRLTAPLSPHLAARRQGLTIESAPLIAELAELAAAWPCVVLELAGGWFSPFDDHLDNAEWLAALPTLLRRQLALILVAPDRLGVLHDLSSTCRAATSLGLRPLAIALSAPLAADDSSGSNAAELALRPATRELPIVSLPRAPVSDLAASTPMAALAQLLLAAS
jgi:dethiobiotin synthetase